MLGTLVLEAFAGLDRIVNSSACLDDPFMTPSDALQHFLYHHRIAPALSHSYPCFIIPPPFHT